MITPEREKPIPLEAKFTISKELQEDPERLKKMSDTFNKVQEKIAQRTLNLKDYRKAIEEFERLGIFTELLSVKGLGFDEAKNRLKGKEFIALGKNYWGYAGPRQEEGAPKPYYEKYIFDGMRGYIRRIAIETSREQVKARKEGEKEMSLYFGEIQDLAIAGKLDKEKFGQAISKAKEFKIIREVSSKELEELKTAKREVMGFDMKFYLYSGPRPEKEKRPPLEFSIYQAMAGGGTIPKEKEGYLYTQMRLEEKGKAIKEAKAREEEKYKVWVERYTGDIVYNQSSQTFRRILENPPEEELYTDLTQALLPEKLKEKYRRSNDTLGKIEEKIKAGQRLSPDLGRIKKEALTITEEIKEAQKNFLEDPKYKRDREDKEIIILSELILKGGTPSEIRDKLREKGIRLEISPSYLEKPKALVEGAGDILGEVLDREIARREKDRPFISALQEKRKEYQVFLEPGKPVEKKIEAEKPKSPEERYYELNNKLIEINNRIKGKEKKLTKAEELSEEERLKKGWNLEKIRSSISDLEKERLQAEKELLAIKDEISERTKAKLAPLDKVEPKEANSRFREIFKDFLEYAYPKAVISKKDFEAWKEKGEVSVEDLEILSPFIGKTPELKEGQQIVEIKCKPGDVEPDTPFSQARVKFIRPVRIENLAVIAG